jgi:hypothetical protein
MGKYPFAGVEFASQCFCGTEINSKAKTGKCATGLLTRTGPELGVPGGFSVGLSVCERGLQGVAKGSRGIPRSR